MLYEHVTIYSRGQVKIHFFHFHCLLNVVYVILIHFKYECDNKNNVKLT